MALPTPEDRSMSDISFAEFEAKARAAGFDEMIERRWAADTVIATHTHAFDADALVIHRARCG
jgi:hypothetical protein